MVMIPSSTIQQIESQDAAKSATILDLTRKLAAAEKVIEAADTLRDDFTGKLIDFFAEQGKLEEYVRPETVNTYDAARRAWEGTK